MYSIYKAVGHVTQIRHMEAEFQQRGMAANPNIDFSDDAYDRSFTPKKFAGPKLPLLPAPVSPPRDRKRVRRQGAAAAAEGTAAEHGKAPAPAAAPAPLPSPAGAPGPVSSHSPRCPVSLPAHASCARLSSHSL